MYRQYVQLALCISYVLHIYTYIYIYIYLYIYMYTYIYIHNLYTDAVHSPPKTDFRMDWADTCSLGRLPSLNRNFY